MIKDIYDKISAGEDLRQNLSELKKELKKEENVTILLFNIGSDYSLFYKLLQSEDAKVRKNTAMVMGEMGVQVFLKPLYESYCKESQLFVKSAYLKAISKLDCTIIREELELRLEQLTKEETKTENEKHMDEEKRVLSGILLTLSKPVHHTFTGYHILSDIVLITNRNHKNITLNQLPPGKKKELNAGVYVQTKDLSQILSIRTYLELLFMIKDKNPLEPEAGNIAARLLSGGILSFLEERHSGTKPFYFRIELKNKMELDKKSAFAKKIASELERQSNRTLINTTTNYEFEIRLIENKQGQYNVLIKLFTVKDERFTYRKNTIGVSIHPVNAALVVQLAKDYLKEGAQVLDPFCGVGTMLIERNKEVSANPMYGLDIYGDTIEKARENAKLDNAIINYINRDFFDFKHSYLFDEIITNMPGKSGRLTEEELKVLYKNFFQKVKQLLKKDGIIILYSNERKLVSSCLKKERAYSMIKEYEINKKEGTYVFILKQEE